MNKSLFEYIDKWGFLSPDGRVSANGIRFTTEWLAVRGFDSPFSHKKMFDLYCRCEKRPGLLMRTPDGEFGQDSIDNYTARIHASTMLRDGFPARFLTYGTEHKGFYNNESPGRRSAKSFLWRFPALVAHAHYANGSRPAWYLRVAWIAAVFQSAMTKSQDGKMLGWHMIRVHHPPIWLMHIWQHRLPFRGLGEIMGKYFNNQFHPLALAMRDLRK